MKLLTPQFSLLLSHVIFTKYVTQKSTLRRLLQFSPPLRFMTPHPNCLLLRTLHFNRKRNTQLPSTDNSDMEPTMLTEKKTLAYCCIFGQVQRGQPESLNLNASPPILPLCTHTNIHTRIYYNAQLFLMVVYLVFVFHTSYHVFHLFSALL